MQLSMMWHLLITFQCNLLLIVYIPKILNSFLFISVCQYCFLCLKTSMVLPLPHSSHPSRFTFSTRCRGAPRIRDLTFSWLPEHPSTSSVFTPCWTMSSFGQKLNHIFPEIPSGLAQCLAHSRTSGFC